nr:CAAX amino terminal protease family protein, putative [Ipomoea batatas]
MQGSGPKWPILRRWDVPWNWQTISLSSLACGLSQFCSDRVNRNSSHTIFGN